MCVPYTFCLSVSVFSGFIFSTAHKSKGLEFDTVKISDDFLSGDSEHSDHRAVDEQGQAGSTMGHSSLMAY